MARPTWLSMNALKGRAEKIAAIIMATGKNPDGTDYTLPVEQASDPRRHATSNAAEPTFEYATGNTSDPVLTSTTLTGDWASGERINRNCRGGRWTVQVTAFTGFTSVTLRVQEWCEAALAWKQLGESVALSAPGDIIYQMYPGLVSVANVSEGKILTRRYQLVLDTVGAGSLTCSIDEKLVL